MSARHSRADQRQIVVLAPTGSGVIKIWPGQFEFAWRNTDRNPHLEVTADAAPLARLRAVKRGGSWTNGATSVRVAKRGFDYLLARRENIGFRCAADLPG